MLLVSAAGAATVVSARAATASSGPGAAPERLSRLEADEAHRTLTAGYVTRAKLGLARAEKLRAAGDEADAVVAERGALTWLDAAETLAQSVDCENEAASLELGALDAGARAERERALLEEALGNAGRRRAELQRIERERGSVAPRVRTADIDGGVSARVVVPASAPERGARDGRAGRDGRDGGGLELHIPGQTPPAGKRAPGSRSAPSEESPP